MIVFAVVNGVIIALYGRREHAEAHAQTILGARVVEVTILTTIAPSAADDIASENWDRENTPVVDVFDTTVASQNVPPIDDD